MRDAYDCITIGGGPAGSTVAALVAEAGFDTLLVEREKMPRFHVGESLMPETYDSLKRLGVWGQLQAGGFVKTAPGKASAIKLSTRSLPSPCSVSDSARQVGHRSGNADERLQ